VHNNNQKS